MKNVQKLVFIIFYREIEYEPATISEERKLSD